MAGRLIWPLPALLVWALAWGVFILLLSVGGSGVLALLLASVLGMAGSLLVSTNMRRLIVALGFPLSLAASGLAQVPAWAWLLPLAVLLALYPLNAWRDAPVFPTPADALRALAQHAPLTPGARVLDAGCGLGDGLLALRRSYPNVELHGLEWSWPLRAACGIRCPWARVRQGDIWRADWSPYAMVYVFQRPESMRRAHDKALAELAIGSWLVSLEFEVAGVAPTRRLQAPDGRFVWLYRIP